MEFRRVARGAAWTVVAGAVLLVGLWLVAVAVNWRDEAPSDDALRLQRVVDERSTVADAGNAYVLLLGIGVRKEDDPFAWGVRRKAYLDAFPAGVEANAPAVLPGKEHDFAGHRTAHTKTLIETCSEANHGCLSLLKQHPEHVDAWLDSESWLLDRYYGLIGLTQWREAIPSDMRVPLPPYVPAMDGQRLLLLKAWRHATVGEAAAARELLQRDLTFWRMVLRSSDILISKMIATAAIRRDFAMGNLVLRELDEVGADASAPVSWNVPIDRGERSMLRAFAGEWRFSKSAVEASLVGGFADRQSGERAYDRVIQPFFKREATSNLLAANMMHLIGGLDVEMTELPATVASLRPPADGRLPSLYNPIGQILSRIGYDAYIPYAVRVSDLEGERRAVLLAAQLRSDGRWRCHRTSLATRIANSQLTEPYRGAPFAWDAVMGSILFQGLESTPRARRAVLL